MCKLNLDENMYGFAIDIYENHPDIGFVLGEGVSTVVIKNYNEYSFLETDFTALHFSKDEKKTKFVKKLYQKYNLPFKEFDYIINDEEDDEYDMYLSKLKELKDENNLELYETQELKPFTIEDDKILETFYSLMEKHLKSEIYSGLTFCSESFMESLTEIYVDEFSGNLEEPLAKSVFKAVKNAFDVIQDMDEEYLFSLDLHEEQFCKTLDGEIICIDPVMFR